jgi:glycosyltransferase involved in cell wall biosynthesis
MHIAIDASRASTRYLTGTEAYSLHIIRGLLAQDASHNFTLYFRDAAGSALFPETASISHKVIKQPRLWTHLGLGPEVKKDNPDVLFVPSHVVPWPHTGTVPSVVTIHDVGYLRVPDTHSLLQRLYLDWSTRHSVQVSSRVITVSHTTADDLVHFKIGTSEKISVVHSGLSSDLRRVTDPKAINEVHTKYGIPGPYILHVGTLRYRKNLHRLVEAFSQLVKRIPDLSLVLVGRPDWGYSELIHKITELNLYGRVIIPGYAEQADLPALYTGASVYAFPSLYEGFGFPVLESMACGTPVVCARASSLPELAGDAAIYFDPYDIADIEHILEKVLTDKKVSADLASAGYKRIELFDWNATARQTLEVLVHAAQDHGLQHST